jgi:hypothetical protein
MILRRDKGWSSFKIGRSRHLQLRVTIGCKTSIKSTGAGDMESAKAFARRFYRNLQPRDQKPPATTFEEAAQDVIRNN